MQSARMRQTSDRQTDRNMEKCVATDEIACTAESDSPKTCNKTRL